MTYDLLMGRTLNLHIRPQRQLENGNTGPDRLGRAVEHLVIDGVHSREVLHVGQEDVDLDDLENPISQALHPASPPRI